ncbi:hypothetical protein GCM10008910_11470 [Faecalicatena orotica]|uniref:23S rRNA (Uracil1939-C5)-methyltransferase n=1 Tax=Faecalicatena orotica TaxID=1544 RepID=A0A2Y9B948_9FIRM|nr:23S rRNA methyltransferase [Faecalicatena orotica]PWJ31194.1 23S rRNA (uracil1939-C5)-methyltransferase [Faecalicatena orotica]SSA54400.1 23S rRNA (uracil1939-C5)-methyltransferase [Faecalicatena orotica]
MDELDLTVEKSKVAYDPLKEYALNRTGLEVSNLYIAQVKDRHGVKKRENYNFPKAEDTLRHFQMI